MLLTNRLLIIVLLLGTLQSQGQTGVLSGRILADSTGQSLSGATILLTEKNKQVDFQTLSDNSGGFLFKALPFGWYKLTISYTGYASYQLDSLHIRADRDNFHLEEIRMGAAGISQMQEVVIYAEKPLIETKEGNIIFNAGESALSAGSTASELLASVPLVSKDPDGKILVKGREPRILIDDKPVSLNLQQLQDLLESMPGSSIEKIEVLTNPPPQYANEQGGVINIVTRKGRVGISGRISLFAGTRGDAGANLSYNYRKKGLAINVNAGFSGNRFGGEGYSLRENIYADSVNFFNTRNEYTNRSIRPNLRATVDYDINKDQSVNLVLNFNQNHYNNRNSTDYKNINQYDQLYRQSLRSIHNLGLNSSPAASLSWQNRYKSGGNLRFIGGLSFGYNDFDRDFNQTYFLPAAPDSVQEMLNETRLRSFSVSLNYSQPLKNKKTSFSLGSRWNRSANHVVVDASYQRRSDGASVKMEALSNDFWFYQTVTNLMGSVKQLIGKDLSVSMGSTVERTDILFRLLKDNRRADNSYYTFLPFANINRRFSEDLNLTLSYRRTIRRPGINELNPTIDFSDPFNIRFGNEKLEASTSDNFDLVIGKTRKEFYLNLGFGYNRVQKVFSQVRTLLDDGITQLTWENISGRKEYELSSWNGVQFSKKFRMNLSATYTYNVYSAFDREVRKFRNGPSFSSNAGLSYIPFDRLNFTGNLALNRFGNPQGFASWNTGMNLGIQGKFFRKKFIVTLNMTDPIRQQIVKRYTYGPNFNLVSENTTRTRNFRITLGYNFSKTVTKKPASSASFPGPG